MCNFFSDIIDKKGNVYASMMSMSHEVIKNY